MRLRRAIHLVPYPLVSAAILTVLLLQVSVTLFSLPLRGNDDGGRVFTFLHRLVVAPTFWPFLNYPMYSAAHFEGDTIRSYSVVATFSDGSERQISPEELGMEPWHFQRHIIQQLLAEDNDRAIKFLESYRPEYRETLDSLRLEPVSLILYEGGVKPAQGR